MIEIPNIRELSRIASEVSGCDHEALREVIAERYPSLEILRAVEQTPRPSREMVVSAPLRREADDLRSFLESKVIEHGSPREVWASLARSGYLISRIKYTPIHFSARFGSNNRDFFQFQFVSLLEEVTHELFCSEDVRADLDDVDDLLNHWKGRAFDRPLPVGHGQYEFLAMLHAPSYLRRCYESELIEIRELEAANSCSDQGQSFAFSFLSARPPRAPINPLGRFFQDWEESSAGLSGALISDHWIIVPQERMRGDLRIAKGIPHWRGEPPNLPPHCYLASSEDLWNYLRDFDSLAGYPFAWFFFMVHGCRIRPEVGLDVLGRVQRGEIILPNADHLVLERWGNSTYTFDAIDFIHVR